MQILTPPPPPTLLDGDAAAAFPVLARGLAETFVAGEMSDRFVRDGLPGQLKALSCIGDAVARWSVWEGLVAAVSLLRELDEPGFSMAAIRPDWRDKDLLAEQYERDADFYAQKLVTG